MSDITITPSNVRDWFNALADSGVTVTHTLADAAGGELSYSGRVSRGGSRSIMIDRSADSYYNVSIVFPGVKNIVSLTSTEIVYFEANRPREARFMHTITLPTIHEVQVTFPAPGYSILAVAETTPPVTERAEAAEARSDRIWAAVDANLANPANPANGREKIVVRAAEPDAEADEAVAEAEAEYYAEIVSEWQSEVPADVAETEARIVSEWQLETPALVTPEPASNVCSNINPILMETTAKAADEVTFQHKTATVSAAHDNIASAPIEIRVDYHPPTDREPARFVTTTEKPFYSLSAAHQTPQTTQAAATAATAPPAPEVLGNYEVIGTDVWDKNTHKIVSRQRSRHAARARAMALSA